MGLNTKKLNLWEVRSNSQKTSFIFPSGTTRTSKLLKFIDDNSNRDLTKIHHACDPSLSHHTQDRERNTRTLLLSTGILDHDFANALESVNHNEGQSTAFPGGSKLMELLHGDPKKNASRIKDSKYEEALLARFMSRSGIDISPSIDSLDLNKEPGRTFIFQVVMSTIHKNQRQDLDAAVNLAKEALDKDPAHAKQYLAKMIKEFARALDHGDNHEKYSQRINSLYKVTKLDKSLNDSNLNEVRKERISLASSVTENIKYFMTQFIAKLDDAQKTELVGSLEEQNIFTQDYPKFRDLIFQALGNFTGINHGNNTDFIKLCVNCHDHKRLTNVLDHIAIHVSDSELLAKVVDSLVQLSAEIDPQYKNSLDINLANYIGTIIAHRKPTDQFTSPAQTILDAQLPRAAVMMNHLKPTGFNHRTSFAKALEHTSIRSEGDDRSLIAELVQQFVEKRTDPKINMDEWSNLIRSGFFANSLPGGGVDPALQYYKDGLILRDDKNDWHERLLANLLKTVPENHMETTPKLDFDSIMIADAILKEIPTQEKIATLDQAIERQDDKVAIMVLRSMILETPELIQWMEAAGKKQLLQTMIASNRPYLVSELVLRGYKANDEEQRAILANVPEYRADQSRQQLINVLEKYDLITPQPAR